MDGAVLFVTDARASRQPSLNSQGPVASSGREIWCAEEEDKATSVAFMLLHDSSKAGLWYSSY
jgi:hypothetical protein